jgi:hypothetical protein
MASFWHPFIEALAPKLNLLVKTTKHLFSKTNSGLFQLPKYLSFIEKKNSQKFKVAPIYLTWRFFLPSFTRSFLIRQEF